MPLGLIEGTGRKRIRVFVRTLSEGNDVGSAETLDLDALLNVERIDGVEFYTVDGVAKNPIGTAVHWNQNSATLKLIQPSGTAKISLICSLK